MSDDLPRLMDDPDPSRRLRRLRGVADHIEGTAADYWRAVDPVRGPLQAAADAPPGDPAGWQAAMTAAAAAVGAAGLGGWVGELRDCPRWSNAIKAGMWGRGIAGRAFCEAFAAAAAGRGFDAEGYRRRLAEHPDAAGEAPGESFTVLNVVLAEHIERVAGPYLERLDAVVAEVGVAGWQLPWALSQAGIALSDGAVRAVLDWDERRTGQKCYGTRLRFGPEPQNDGPQPADGESPPDPSDDAPAAADRASGPPDKQPPALSVADLSECHRLAGHQYRQGLSSLQDDGNHTPTDREVYDRLVEDEVEVVGYETWAKYVRVFRQATGTTKRPRRKPGQSRSAVKFDELDTPGDD